MKNLKYLICIMIGILLTISINIVGASIESNGVMYNSKTLNTVLDDLYSKINEINNTGDAVSSDILSGKTALVKGTKITGTMPSSGYVALFSGSSSISSTAYNVPIVYTNSDYSSSDGYTLTLNKSGTYRIIGTVSHSPLSTTFTSELHFVVNGITNESYSRNNWGEYYYSNFTVTVNSPVTISAYLSSDGTRDGLRGGTAVIIKES